VAVARDRLARTRLVHPRQRLDQGRMRLADLEDRLHAAIAGRAQRARQRLAAVRLVAPSARVQAARVRLDLAVARMPAALVRRRGDAGAAFGAAVARLEALSPLAVLTRGYAIAQVDGRVILDARTVPVGAALEVRVQTGRLRARVEGVDG
jgi:exodeoxyribonuclease VII large subunit